MKWIKKFILWIQRKKICWQCDGSGKYTSECDARYGGFFEYKCDVCNGTGIISKKYY